MRNQIIPGQEPITRSIQLPCVRATAFSQVGLFLDLQVLSVKISVSEEEEGYESSRHGRQWMGRPRPGLPPMETGTDLIV